MTDRSPAELTRHLQHLLHQSANDAAVLLALAEAAESNPNRVGELLAEVRRRAPRWIEGLREAVLLAQQQHREV